MGEVWQARDPASGEEAAVKLLAGLIETEERLRFERESRALVELRHPGVVRWLEGGQDEGGPWIALELCPGGTLEARVRASGPLEAREAVALASELSAAVAAAHRAGVLHRDLKPSNVLFDQDGRPRLADFGLARPVARGDSLTATGTIMGTPGFLAPEQVAGDKDRIGPATDVYGLGATLYYLLTGQPPFVANSVMAGLRAVLHEPPRPPSASRPDLSPSLDALVLRCLAKSPAARYTNASALRAALDGWLAGPVPRASRWRLLVALGVLLLGAMATILALPPRQSRDGVAPESTARQPMDAAAWLLSGRRKLSQGDAAGAISDLDRAIELDPSLALAWGERGVARMNQGDAEGASVDLWRATELGSTDASIRVAQGLVLANLGRYGDAIAILDSALAIHPRHPNLLIARASVRVSLEQLPSALEDFDRALAIDPRSFDGLVGRAHVRTALGSPDAALADLDRALDLNPSYREARRQRGLLLARLGKNEEALAELGRALQLEPQNALLLTRRGQVLAVEGRFSEALADLDRAEELDPTQTGILAYRGCARLGLGEPEKALADLERALESDPQGSFALAQRGLARAALGQREAAIDDITQALQASSPAWWTERAREKLVELERP